MGELTRKKKEKGFVGSIENTFEDQRPEINVPASYLMQTYIL